MSQSIASPVPVYTIPDSALAERVRRSEVRREWRKARRMLRAAMAQSRAYDGSPLEGEKSSRKNIRKDALKAARLACRRAFVSRIGRRIALASLLIVKRPDGRPLWTICDPRHPVGENNGRWNTGSQTVAHITQPGPDIRVPGGRVPDSPSIVPTGGIPPLPAAARRAVTDPHIRKRALWVGLLYQPEGWEEVRPDPAIVVEWKDRPGEYYALVVWGPDRPRIMEFVD